MYAFSPMTFVERNSHLSTGTLVTCVNNLAKLVQESPVNRKAYAQQQYDNHLALLQRKLAYKAA